LAPASHAAHSTTFLDNLQAEIDARQADTSELSAKQKGALKAAAAILRRNSKTTSADLGQLNAASTVLNRAFADDETLSGLESDSLNSFLAEAESQRGAVQENLSLETNNVPKSINNLLAQADAAISNAHTQTNLSAQIHSTGLAFTKIRAAGLAVARLIKAPASLEGKTVTLKERAAHNPTLYKLDSDGTFTSGSDSGTWDYQRTSANTGTIVVTTTPNDTNPGGSRTFDLTFKTGTAGTFAEEAEEGGVNGNFTVSR